MLDCKWFTSAFYSTNIVSVSWNIRDRLIHAEHYTVNFVQRCMLCQQLTWYFSVVPN